jgi:hypothetical protein
MTFQYTYPEVSQTSGASLNPWTTNYVNLIGTVYSYVQNGVTMWAAKFSNSLYLGGDGEYNATTCLQIGSATCPGFGFVAANANSAPLTVPSGHTIVGIQVNLYSSGVTVAGPADVQDETVLLTNGGVGPSGEIPHASSSYWPDSPSSPQYCTYGGPSDLWGCGANYWTPSNISALGLQFAAQCPVGTPPGMVAQIYFPTITVYYQ